MFFPFCDPFHQGSHRERQQHKLTMLKAMRDSLETRLAALNAAISTIERQMAEAGAGDRPGGE